LKESIFLFSNLDTEVEFLLSCHTIHESLSVLHTVLYKVDEESKGQYEAFKPFTQGNKPERDYKQAS